MPGGPADATLELLRGRPELHEGYVAFRDTIVQESGLDPTLLGRCRVRVRWLLTARDDEPVARDAFERAVFLADPTSFQDEDRRALERELTGEQMVELGVVPTPG